MAPALTSHEDKVIRAGERVGRLTVLELLPERVRRYRVYRCRCDCGQETRVRSDLLRSGKIRSCGCSRIRSGEPGARKGGKDRRRNRVRHPLYGTWCGMRYRCNDPKHQDYRYYGARGITVDPRWLDFKQFLADVGPRPGPRWELHRKDAAGPYSPENCQWVERTAHRKLHPPRNMRHVR